MKNFQKMAFGLLVAVLAVGFSAFTNAKHSTYVGAYRYNQATQQPWSSTGALPADQTAGHYSTYSGTPNCQTSSNICTYDLVGTNFVQTTQGTFR